MSGALVRGWVVVAMGALSIPLLIGTTWAQPKGATAKGATITAKVAHFKNNSGQAMVALFKSDDGFPTKWAKAVTRATAKIKGRKATYSFKNVKPGAWALAVIHDANKNGKMDTNFLGIPKEGWGTSRNPRPTVGPPGFKDAKFMVKKGDRAFKILMTY
jgi:uncharacterized protein (DUF2141 family)